MGKLAADNRAQAYAQAALDQNLITADKQSYENQIAETTGIVLDWKKGSTADRKAIRALRDGQVSQLNADIVKAIQIGEAKIKQVEQAASAGIDESKTMLLTTISSSVENMADNIFATVQGNRAKIADN